MVRCYNFYFFTCIKNMQWFVGRALLVYVSPPFYVKNADPIKYPGRVAYYLIPTMLKSSCLQVLHTFTGSVTL